MKKIVALLIFVTLFSCASFAQDSISTGKTKKGTIITQKKKALPQSNTTIRADSVNEGKIVTNPHGKTVGKPLVRKKIPAKNITLPGSTGLPDSAR